MFSSDIKGRGFAKTRRVTIRKTRWTPPVTLFPSLCTRQGFIWLDSGMFHGGYGRWSFMMWSPFMALRGAKGAFELSENGGTSVFTGDPFDLLAKLSARWNAGKEEGAPPFTGGAAGFFGYGLLSYCEPSTAVTAREKAQEGDIWLGFYDRLIAFDHENQSAMLVVNLEEGADPEPALNRLEEVAAKALKESGALRVTATAAPALSEAKSNFTKDEYMRAVNKVREYIELGDCYQVNIAQKFTAPARQAAPGLYLRLRSLSPAPFAAYIDTGESCVLSSSPERFLSLREGAAQTRPIKGTRPRGKAPDEDARFRDELEKSEKDRAENIMIVDLLRNDLSKVCLPGSVRATELCRVEEFPTVFHLTSTVEGRLKPGVGPFGLLKASFPGGSVTGAPKIRAMEIIDELEPDPRGVYCGAIGYIGFDGEMDTNVAIRTMVHTGASVSFHAGGGVTYLSGAEAEYQETMDKARAMLEAIGG